MRVRRVSLTVQSPYQAPPPQPQSHAGESRARYRGSWDPRLSLGAPATAVPVRRGSRDRWQWAHHQARPRGRQRVGQLGQSGSVAGKSSDTPKSSNTAQIGAESVPKYCPYVARGPRGTKKPPSFRGFLGGRYWDRTSDLFRVREARYRCANRPFSWGVAGVVPVVVLMKL